MLWPSRLTAARCDGGGGEPKTGVWVNGEALYAPIGRHKCDLVAGQQVIAFVFSTNTVQRAARPEEIAPVRPAGPTFGADWGDDGTSGGSILFGASNIMRVSGSGGEPVAIGLTDAFYPRMLPHGRFFYTSGQKGAVLSAPLDHPASVESERTRTRIRAPRRRDRKTRRRLSPVDSRHHAPCPSV
jgi:hypothetical protein